jgi:hypothetical protein
MLSLEKVLEHTCGEETGLSRPLNGVSRPGTRFGVMYDAAAKGVIMGGVAGPGGLHVDTTGSVDDGDTPACS